MDMSLFIRGGLAQMEIVFRNDTGQKYMQQVLSRKDYIMNIYAKHTQ